MFPLQHLQATRLTRISTILLLALTSLATAMTTPSTAITTDETPNLARRQEMSSGSSCDGSEGQWNCMTTSFQRCGSGRWSEVQQCALGTHCSPSGLTYQFHVDFADGYLGAAPPTTSRASIGSALADWLLLCGLAIALSWS
ncbi:hypothetical protein E0Z10_g5437 [Xylaria hypoxylon]|uniref:Extracellular membrane protein CFEM domain-containing protein n=1 Tax=Xylaria hypoxylon TaxID=37992 RepID=A0A4Z0YTD7_9PEZI|nr:hypothetical protein E0Z10_g5437 [Xylaria hypoxylon]